MLTLSNSHKYRLRQRLNNATSEDKTTTNNKQTNQQTASGKSVNHARRVAQLQNLCFPIPKRRISERRERTLNCKHCSTSSYPVAKHRITFKYKLHTQKVKTLPSGMQFQFGIFNNIPIMLLNTCNAIDTYRFEFCLVTWRSDFPLYKVMLH